MKEMLEEKYELKVDILGPDEGQKPEVKVLNRVIRWQDQKCIEYEADPKHRQLVLEAFGLNDESKSLTVNGHREDRQPEDWETELLDKKMAKRFKSEIPIK